MTVIVDTFDVGRPSSVPRPVENKLSLSSHESALTTHTSPTHSRLERPGITGATGPPHAGLGEAVLGEMSEQQLCERDGMHRGPIGLLVLTRALVTQFLPEAIMPVVEQRIHRCGEALFGAKAARSDEDDQRKGGQ